MKKIIHQENGRTRVQTINTKPELTQQQFKDECDINNIIRKYTKTGNITHLNMKRGVYADMSQLPDYQTSLDTVLKANSAFETLPSQVRQRFANNPQLLMEFLNDDKNYEEAIKLGLMDKEKSQNYYKNKNQKQNQNSQSQTQNPNPSQIQS